MIIFVLTILIVGGVTTFIGWYFGYKHYEDTNDYIRWWFWGI